MWPAWCNVQRPAAENFEFSDVFVKAFGIFEEALVGMKIGGYASYNRILPSLVSPEVENQRRYLGIDHLLQHGFEFGHSFGIFAKNGNISESAIENFMGEQSTLLLNRDGQLRSLEVREMVIHGRERNPRCGVFARVSEDHFNRRSNRRTRKIPELFNPALG